MLRLACALLDLGAALAGLVLAVRCALNDEVSGGHFVLAALFALWAAQRGLEGALQTRARERGLRRPHR